MATRAIQIPTVALVNESTVSFGFQPKKLLPALQEFIDVHFGPVWNCFCKLLWCEADKVPAGVWQLALRNDSDEEDALAYHTLTDEGLPRSIAFVRTTKEAGDAPTDSIGHELGEMLANPWLNACCEWEGVAYSREPMDPVEGATFEVGGLRMPNFVHPAWYEGWRKAGSVRFDHLGLCKRPLVIQPEGYQPALRGGRWTELFGHRARQKVGKRERLRAKHILARSVR